MNKPLIEFNHWPAEKAEYYCEKGYWINQPLTQILSQSSEKYPNATAIICGDRKFSYSDLNSLSSNLAANITAYGIGKGDTALVQLPNIAEFFIVYFALLKAGIVPLNALYSHRSYELRSFCQQIKPKLFIVSSQHESFKDENFINDIQNLDKASRLVLRFKDNSSRFDLSKWIEEVHSNAVEYSPTPANEVAFFQLSGGSTGTPKLIPRTHNDYYYSIRASADICQVTADTRLLCALPAAHNFMLSSPGALGVFYKAGCVVMAANPEPLHCFSIINHHHVTMVSLVPSAVIAWMEQAPKYINDLNSLKLIQVGGANFSENLARKTPSIFQCQLQQVFGMAEGLVNYTRLDDPDEQVFTSQGRPISEDDEVMIIDEQGNSVPEGATGMLITRGPYTFRGYYQAPTHNNIAFDNQGYYHTGDLVQRTPEGNLRVVGRAKEQINRGGEKIATAEVENLILSHPDVLAVGLIPVADSRLGEKICAYVVSRYPTMKSSTLRRYLLELDIAQYKIPDRFKFIESMPLTAIGKIDKNALRNL